MRRYPAVVTLVTALALLVSACESGTGDSTTTTAIGTTTPAPSTSTTQPTTTSTTTASTTTTFPAESGLVIYFLLQELGEDTGGPFLVPVYRDVVVTDDPILTTLETLVVGPSDSETVGTPSISSEIPNGTSVLGVGVADGVASVDLSEEFDDGGGSFSMFARLAQVVYTMTGLDGIDQVLFLIEGEPVDVFSGEGILLDGSQERSDYYDMLPLVFVDSPAWAEPVTSPVHVSGLSNAFEAVSQVMLTDDDGLPLFEDMVMASCGTGCWGEWEIDIPYTVDRDQFGALIVWEDSAEDGSRIHVREYPIQLRQ